MLAAVALAGLVLAATAQAKGPIQLCGPASCAPLGSETAPPIPLGAGPEMQLVPPVAPTGYYEIRFADVEGVLGYWVPAAGAVRLRDAVGLAAWVAADANQLALLQQASAGIAAYTAPTKADVWVNGAFVRSPVGSVDRRRQLGLDLPQGQLPQAGRPGAVDRPLAREAHPGPAAARPLTNGAAGGFSTPRRRRAPQEGYEPDGRGRCDLPP